MCVCLLSMTFHFHTTFNIQSHTKGQIGTILVRLDGENMQSLHLHLHIGATLLSKTTISFGINKVPSYLVYLILSCLTTVFKCVIGRESETFQTAGQATGEVRPGGPPTGAELPGRHPDPHAGGGVRGAGRGQQVAAGQLQLHEDHWVGAGDGVLGVAQVVLQRLALVAAQQPAAGAARLLVAQREHVVAEGRDGELRALVRQVGGRANHGEGRWRRVEEQAYIPGPLKPSIALHVFFLISFICQGQCILIDSIVKMPELARSLVSICSPWPGVKLAAKITIKNTFKTIAM